MTHLAVRHRSGFDELLSRHVRWQAVIALLGLLLVVALLSYATYTYTSEYVPARGGVFVEGVVGNPQYINPVLCQYNEVDRDLCALVFNGLLRFDEQGNLQPDLAESWEVNATATVYTFTLRSDIRWHDGLRITADDVIFTVQLMQDPELPVLPDLAALWRSVIPIRVNDRTVVFQLSGPYAAFPDYTTIRWFGVLPRHYWQRYSPAELPQAQLNTQPIGSGPFRVTEIDSQHVRLEPNLRQMDETPYLDALEFRFYPDYGSILAAAEMGEVHGVSRILPEYLSQAENMPDLQLFTSPLPGYSLILFNVDNPNAPFLQEQAVRQALAYGLNRERLLNDVIPGVGMPADSPILPGTWAYNPDIPRYEYSPEQARTLLDASGWVDTDGDGIRDKDGVPLSFALMIDDAPSSLLIAQTVAADWAQIGVQVQPEPVSFTGLVSDFLVPRNFAAAIVQWELIGDPDPYPLWHSSQISPEGQNFSGWQNRDADIAMEQARITPVRAERARYYRQFQTYFAQDVPAILLYYPLYTYGASTAVNNMEVGRLNVPADRFRTFPRWYILTHKVTLAQRQLLQLDKPQE
ncbi:MAG: peptide ABC transporter substrate-binding protein [Caldilineae bacterium]|nr:MAG: peptide ABC transporter substrate-binding protein [Caldilineae bacterium]